jgi:hypothetical protein
MGAVVLLTFISVLNTRAMLRHFRYIHNYIPKDSLLYKYARFYYKFMCLYFPTILLIFDWYASLAFLFIENYAKAEEIYTYILWGILYPIYLIYHYKSIRRANIEYVLKKNNNKSIDMAEMKEKSLKSNKRVFYIYHTILYILHGFCFSVFYF